MSKLLEKSWIPASARTTTTFNAPGNFQIPYGRYSAKISGRGAPGNAPNASTWNTNYNTAFPIGNQPFNGFNTDAQWKVDQLDRSRCFGGWASAPISYYPYVGIVTNQVVGEFTLSQLNVNYCNPGFSGWGGNYFYVAGGNIPVQNLRCQQAFGQNAIDSQNQRLCTLSFVPGSPVYSTNYNVAYPVANRPVSTYNLANAGANSNVFGVAFPGGAASAQIGVPNPASPVSNTAFSYWELQDNRTASITVPSGGALNITLE